MGAAGTDGAAGSPGRADPAPVAVDTARLSLEVLTPAHAPLLIGGLGDPALYRWLDAPPPDLERLTQRFERVCRRPAPDGQRWLNWALRAKQGGSHVGTAEATVYPGGEVNLAYFVFTPHQGKGYAVEACTAIIAHLARNYAAGPFLIAVDTRNTASQRVAEKLGFVRAAEPVLAGTLRGEPQWDYRYSLTLRQQVPGGR